MPGSVSDSYDPEWGTSANAEVIRDALNTVYAKLSDILGRKPPVDIRQLATEGAKRTRDIPATLTEWDWRMLRFAVERARDSV